MDEYVNTGVYLRILWDELRYNMELQLNKKGYHDVTPSHGWVLYNVKDSGSRITELATLAKITKQSMSALAGQMEEAGYIKRKPDPSDKRATLFVLTSKGKKMKEAGQTINREYEKQWQKKLGDKDYHTLRLLLQKLSENDV
jgi:DNA-binding MarR family transcriptional regulator